MRLAGLAIERRLGWLVVLAGGALALAVQVAAPVGVPLYDGVVVSEPYRYLHPTANQAGSPTTFASTPVIRGGVSPVFVAATSESPPQSQLIAQRGAFELPAGTTSLQVSITPIEPPATPPAGGAIAGNVYRVTVTDQAGTPLRVKACDSCLSLVIRAPDGVDNGTVGRYAGGAWTNVSTLHAGMVGMYQTNPSDLGDFAVIAGGNPGQVPGADAGADTFVLVGLVAVAVLLSAAVFILVRGRRSREPPPARPTQGRIPSKRRAPRRPPQGRSDR